MRVIGLRQTEPADRTMRRRELIAIAGTGLVAWPLVGHAQQQARSARLGYLGLGSPAGTASVVRIEALRAGLRDLGYVEGKNLVIEFRWSASPTSATGSAWERTPWHAVQEAAWEALNATT